MTRFLNLLHPQLKITWHQRGRERELKASLNFLNRKSSAVFCLSHLSWDWYNSRLCEHLFKASFFWQWLVFLWSHSLMWTLTYNWISATLLGCSYFVHSYLEEEKVVLSFQVLLRLQIANLPLRQIWYFERDGYIVQFSGSDLVRVWGTVCPTSSLQMLKDVHLLHLPLWCSS